MVKSLIAPSELFSPKSQRQNTEACLSKTVGMAVGEAILSCYIPNILNMFSSKFR